MSNAIKYWRNKRNMSQQKLADLIDIDRPTLSKIENPNIPIDPNEELAFEIARILKVLVTDIVKEVMTWGGRASNTPNKKYENE